MTLEFTQSLKENKLQLMVARLDTYLLYYLRFQKCDLQPDF